MSRSITAWGQRLLAHILLIQEKHLQLKAFGWPFFVQLWLLLGQPESLGIALKISTSVFNSISCAGIDNI